MPRSVIKRSAAYPEGWAKIENGVIRWRAQSEASVFPDHDSALKAYHQAREGMLVKARAKLAAALAEGKIRAARGRFGSPRAPRLEDYATSWITTPQDPPVVAISSQDELCGSMALWFVRHRQAGWLTPWRHDLYEFQRNFHAAQPFFSEEAALAAVKTLRGVNPADLSVGRAAMAFESFAPVVPGSPLDPQAQAIAAACEARELAQASAAPAPAAPRAPRPRV